MELTEKTRESNLLYDGKLLKLYRDEVELAGGGVSVREYVHHPGGVCAVALDGDGNVYLERQFRYPFRRVILELPAGKLEPGEDPADAIRRELREEIGATAARWDSLGSILPSVGYTDETLHLYLARELTFGANRLDPDEFLEPFPLPFDEALEMAADGRISDGKSVAALFRAARRIRGERHG